MLVFKKFKFFLLLIIVSLAICIVCAPFVYCEQWKPDIKFLTIAAGAAEWELIGAKLSDLIHKEIPEIATTSIPGGGEINCIRVNSGEAGIGLTHTGFQDMMIKGISPFTEPLSKVRAMMCLYRVYFMPIVRRDSNIHSISDLGERPYTVWISTPGKGAYVYGVKLLNVYGVTLEKIKEMGGVLEQTEYNDGDKGFMDRRIDYICYPGSPIPYARAIQLSSIPGGIRLLPISGEERENYIRTVPGTYKTIIPANTYQGQEEDVETIGMAHMLICNADLSDELVYRIMDIIMRNVQDIKNLTKSLQINFVKDVTEGIGTIIPFHPGAKKYLEEHGTKIE